MQLTAQGETVMAELAERQAVWAANLAAAHDSAGLEAEPEEAEPYPSETPD